MTQPIEVVFYVHGVSGDRSGRSHLKEYRLLHEGIRKFRADFPEAYGGAEWGWNPTGEQGQSHQLLTEAQNQLGQRAVSAIKDARDWTLNPLRLTVQPIRELFFYSFGDMFYYVSKNGKQAIRARVADQLYSHLRPFMANDHDRPISLTLLGHSAGSVIAFDFSFFLFQQVKPGYQFIEQDHPDVGSDAFYAVQELRRLADIGQLRIRRLYTFGSPITPLAFRSDAVVEILAGGGQLKLDDYGLTNNPEGFPPLEGPRWLNFWDKDDLIGWPVEPLMQPSSAGSQPIVVDMTTDVSDLLSKAHNGFWESEEMHRGIGENW